MHSNRIDQSTMEQTKERSPPQLNYSHNESCLLLPINQCVPRQWLLTGTQVMPQSVWIVLLTRISQSLQQQQHRQRRSHKVTPWTSINPAGKHSPRLASLYANAPGDTFKDRWWLSIESPSMVVVVVDVDEGESIVVVQTYCK